MSGKPDVVILQAGVQTAGEWRACVHSVFEHAVNIIANQTRFTLLDKPDWISENNLIFSDPEFFSGIEHGSVLQTQGQHFYIDGVPVARYPAQAIWKMPVLLPVRISSGALSQVGMFLQNANADAVVARVAQQFYTAARCFLNEKVASFSQVVGAGPGLTPSGDDMLVGFALAVFCYCAERLSNLERCLLPYLGHTTDISRYLLVDALSGRFTAPLVSLLLALQHTRNIDHAISVAADVGSSSGRDGILGLYYGLRLLNEVHGKVLE